MPLLQAQFLKPSERPVSLPTKTLRVVCQAWELRYEPVISVKFVACHFGQRLQEGPGHWIAIHLAGFGVDKEHEVTAAVPRYCDLGAFGQHYMHKPVGYECAYPG